MKKFKKILVLLGTFLLLNNSLNSLPSIRVLEKEKSQSVTAKNDTATKPSSSYTSAAEVSESTLSPAEKEKLTSHKTALTKGNSSKDPGKLSSQKISLTGKDLPGGETHLTVRTNVSGAAVYVDGNYAGRAPLTIKTIGAGTHQVRIEAQGYETQVVPAYVVKGKSNFCYAVLEKNKGVIDIHTNIEGCLFYCDGVRLPFGMARIEEGIHTIKVRKFGYRDFEAQIMIKAFTVKRIFVSMETAPFEVTSLTASRNAFNPNYQGALGKCVITGSVTNTGSGITEIRNEAGKLVAKKEFPQFTTWDQVFTWNGKDRGGDKLPAGIYTITFTAENYSLSVQTRIDYTLTYYLYDFADGGLGIGSVPVALSVPEHTLYIGAVGKGLFTTKGHLSNFPVGGAFAYSPFKGLDFDFNLQFYPDKEPKIITDADGVEQEVPMFLAGGSVRYAGTILSAGPVNLNLGGFAGYGWSEHMVYPPFGMADGRGINFGVMLGADMSMLFVGFTSQYFMGATTSDPTFGDNTWKNSLAVMFRPFPELAVNGWASLHSANGYFSVGQGGKHKEAVDEFVYNRALELGAEISVMIPATSLYVTAGGLLYCYPRKKIYYGGQLGIKYIF